MTTDVRRELLEAEDALQAVYELELQNTLWRRERTAKERQAQMDELQALAARRQDKQNKEAFDRRHAKDFAGVRNYDSHGNNVDAQRVNTFR